MKNSFIGIDGCKYGWIAIEIINETQFSFELLKNISAIHKYKKSQILIDMPIGLSDESINRNIDIKAKKLLSTSKKSSIFIPPCREAVYANSYEDAKKINQKTLGKSLSIQAWNICPKIKELDIFLIEKSTHIPFLREAHPEICFTLLNNGSSFSSKKSTPEGQNDRLNLLQSHFKNAKYIFESVLSSTKRKDVKKDDILDALVLAVCGFLHHNKSTKKIINTPLKDKKGLEISLWYF